MSQDAHYQEALHSLQQTLSQLRGCSAQEQAAMVKDLTNLEAMHAKLAGGRVEIVVFGEISTGKSALINALLGQEVTSVNVQGGWTKTIDPLKWETAEYSVPGLEESQVVLVDTPGLNEVGGGERASLATEAARGADLILFVVDSDLNEIEYSSILLLKSVNKPMILVLNKFDLYSRAEQTRLVELLRDERLKEIIEPENFVTTKAKPREVERIIESADGSSRSEWFQPQPDVAQLKARVLEVLEHDGLALLALNAALYSADQSDRIATIRVRLREKQANAVIWSYASIKAVAVGCNSVPIADVLGGVVADVLLVITLAKVYGLKLSWVHARSLVAAILEATGWMSLMVYASSFFKAITVGWGTVLTAIPQGAAAGYGAYIVGQAAKYYFEHGSSWGSEGPKSVVQRILSETDRDSVINHLKDEIQNKIRWNRHAQEK